MIYKVTQLFQSGHPAIIIHHLYLIVTILGLAGSAGLAGDGAEHQELVVRKPQGFCWPWVAGGLA